MAAFDLTAVFQLRDRGSTQLRNITRSMERMDRATQQASRASDTYRNSNTRLQSAMSQVTREGTKTNTMMGRFKSGASSLRSSFGSLQSQIAGIAGAYLTARGAAALFNNTIGAAAKFEQSEVAVKAIFNDDAKSSAYLKMVDKMAIDSPLLNSGEMLGASKSLVAMTKNVDELGAAWSIIEKLMVLDPTQGTDGAAFALKEMWQGDALSMVERFGLDKKKLNEIKKLKIPQQISAINGILDGMGITQETIDKMGGTTLGYWAQIQERADKFKRIIGETSNTKLGDSLAKVVNALDSPKVDEFANLLNEKLAGVFDKIVDISAKMWEWREPIGYIAGAIGIAFGSLAAFGIVSSLANPLSLFAAGISVAVVGFKALYDKSEGFRNMIDGITSKASELWSTFKEGGTGGLLNSLFGEGTSDKVGAVFGAIKGWIAEMTPSFMSIKDSVSDIFSTIWTIIKDVWAMAQPLLSTAWEYIKSFGGVVKMVFENLIAPSFAYFAEALKMVWGIAQPILSLLAGAFDVIASVALFLWDMALAPLLGFITGTFGEGLKWLTGILETVGGWFETVGGWVDWAHDKLSDFASFITGIKVPDWIANGVSTAVDFVGGIFGNDSKVDGSHYSGLNYVPYDGYTAKLHKGEQILTSQDAKEYRKGSQASGITITGNTFNVRQESDIRSVALDLAKLIEREAFQVGY